jgi:cholestenol delta-isomerase
MYGDILYYGTSMFDHYVANISYSRPEAFYFWVYFVGMNAPWIIIPGGLIWSSMSYIGKAVSNLQKAERKKKK